MFAVVTTYHRESEETLARVIASVEALQSDVPVRHFLIADGYPQRFEPSPDRTHIVLPPQEDAIDTPRLVGAAIAIREGCDGLMFLDADSVVYPDHARLAYEVRAKSGCDIVVAGRDSLRADGSVAENGEGAGFDADDSGCFVFFGAAVQRALDWSRIPQTYSAAAGRAFWRELCESAAAAGSTFARMPHPTIGARALGDTAYV